MYPAGRAVVLLAVCSTELAGRRLTIEGRRVQAIPYGRLALLVAFVDQDTYAHDELERRRNDAAWLATEARILEHAVERMRTNGAIVPMRLLTAFPHADALEEAARESYARWSRTLTRLGGKRECALHLYTGPHAPPAGEPYLMRISGRASRTGRAPAMKAAPAVLGHAHSVWRACASVATATRRVQTGGRRGALWSAVMLVPENGVATLAAALEASAEAGALLGVTAYLEAPRAPFTFV